MEDTTLALEAACKLLCIDPPDAVVLEEKLSGYTRSQRGMFGAQLVTSRVGYNRWSIGTISPKAVATLLRIGKEQIKEARRLRRFADQEVIAGVECGAFSIYAAAKLVKHPELLSAVLEHVGAHLPPHTVSPKSAVPKEQRKPQDEVLGRFIRALGHAAEAVREFAGRADLTSIQIQASWLAELRHVEQVAKRLKTLLTIAQQIEKERGR